MALEERDRIDAAFKAAEMHLSRLEILGATGWKVSFSAWTLLIAMLGLAATKPELFTGGGIKALVALGVFLLLMAYYSLLRENYNSLASERKYYVCCRNRALELAQIDDLAVKDRSGNLVSDMEPVPGNMVHGSTIFHMRMCVTMILVITLMVMVLFL